MLGRVANGPACVEVEAGTASKVALSQLFIFLQAERRCLFITNIKTQIQHHNDSHKKSRVREPHVAWATTRYWSTCVNGPELMLKGNRKNSNRKNCNRKDCNQQEELQQEELQQEGLQQEGLQQEGLQRGAGRAGCNCDSHSFVRLPKVGKRLLSPTYARRGMLLISLQQWHNHTHTHHKLESTCCNNKCD